MDHGKLIAVRMEEARDARGISVAELARRASIDRKRLWYILDGQRLLALVDRCCLHFCLAA